MSLHLPAPAPRRQHVVSQVVLRRFTTGGLLEALTLEHPRAGWRRYPPSAVGYVRDFVQVDAEQVERVWGEVEARLPDAFEILDRQNPVIAGSPTESTLLDCLALHWARSGPVRDVSERAWSQVRARSHADFAERPALLDIGFRQLTGLHPAGPEARRIANDRLHEGPDDIRSGKHFADRVVEYFQHARSRLATSHLAVYDLPEDADDLVLSDSPVIAPDTARTGWGPASIALGQATALAMPVGPRTAICAHTAPTRETITTDQARELDDMQRLVATAYLYRRPTPRPANTQPRRTH